MRTILIGMASLAALWAGPMLSQPVGPPGPTTAEYFILTAPRDPISVTVNVRPRVGQSRPVDLERIAPGENVLRQALRVNWTATAACRFGLRTLTISGPGGALNQEFPGNRNAIAGTTSYQSFSTEAVDGQCFAWARGVLAQCGWPLEPGRPECANATRFIFDAGTPLPDNPPVVVGGTCNGPLAVDGRRGPAPATALPILLPSRSYQGRLDLRCVLGEI